MSSHRAGRTAGSSRGASATGAEATAAWATSPPTSSAVGMSCARMPTTSTPAVVRRVDTIMASAPSASRIMRRQSRVEAAMNLRNFMGRAPGG